MDHSSESATPLSLLSNPGNTSNIVFRYMYMYDRGIKLFVGQLVAHIVAAFLQMQHLTGFRAKLSLSHVVSGICT